MSRNLYGNLLPGAAALAIFAGLVVGSLSHVLAYDHHRLNGTWQLISERSEFHGEPVIPSGTVTIDDREGNVYVSHSFTLDGVNQSRTSTFTTDAREKASIREPGGKTKTQWKGDVLEVTSFREGAASVERYRLEADGTMVMTIDRPGHAPETLLFRRGE